MGRRLVAAAGIGAGLTLVGLFAAPGASAATPDPQPELQVVVMLSPAVAAHAVSVLGAVPGSLPRPIVADRWRFDVPEGEVAATIDHLEATTGVEYASTAHIVHATGLDSSPDDPCYTGTCGGTGSSTTVIDPDASLAPDGGPPYATVTASQPDLAQVGAPEAWSISHGSPSVTVAVLDTGVNAEQQDLAADVTAGPVLCAGDDPSCTNPNGGDPDDTDDNGHGTHVTGTIAAASDNGEGVASLGWATHAEVYKVLDAAGAGTTTDLATGIYDAVASGASVINMSLGDDPCTSGQASTTCGPDLDTETAVDYALAHDVVVVAAAGNDGSSLPSYPAGYPGVLSVAAVNGGGVVDGYSEYGDAADIAAPGDDILSTWNTDAEGVKSDDTYAILSGTSMASPHVAAAAALVRATNPTLSAPEVASLLETTALPVAAGGHTIDGGVLDAGAAVADAASPPAYSGYRMAGADGSVYPFGATPWDGDLSGTTLSKPIVGIASLPGETGYWEVGADGGVFSFGSAGFHGSTGDLRLNQPIVGMASTPDGGGYWLVAADGGIFSFGDAVFEGSTGSYHLNQPVVGMAATPDGKGYWLVAADGGIFTFGDGVFEGSTGSLPLNRPIVGMAPTATGKGYWLVSSDGGIFSFGDATFYGSAG